MSKNVLRLVSVNDLPAYHRDRLRQTVAEVAAVAVAPKPKRKTRDEEHNEQAAFINRLRCLALKDRRYEPAVNRTYAIPNGGGRSKAQAGRLKAEGVRSGIPDLFVSYPVAPFHGLYIEMKSLSGDPSREQRLWISNSVALGYMAACCRGADQAMLVWLAYVDPSL